MEGLDWSNSSTVRTRLVGWYMRILCFLQSSRIISQTRTDFALLTGYTSSMKYVKRKELRSTHNLSCGPSARLGGEKSARTPRAPARGFAPCTPIYAWISGRSNHDKPGHCAPATLQSIYCAGYI